MLRHAAAPLTVLLSTSSSLRHCASLELQPAMLLSQPPRNVPRTQHCVWHGSTTTWGACTSAALRGTRAPPGARLLGSSNAHMRTPSASSSTRKLSSRADTRTQQPTLVLVFSAVGARPPRLEIAPVVSATVSIKVAIPHKTTLLEFACVWLPVSRVQTRRPVLPPSPTATHS